MWERYTCPISLEAALAVLSERPEETRIIAGGTDLILELERGVRTGVSTLIDITRIPGLDQIHLDEDGWVHMGPLVTHNHVAGSELIQKLAFALAQACLSVGAPQIRNRGTLAGNLITASPANDSITPLMALGARVTLRSEIGERVVPLADFYKGVRTTVMREDEFLTDIAFPLPPEGGRSTFYKVGLRQAQAISVVNVAVLLTFNGTKIEQARITLGSVAPSIIRAQEAEELLTGRELDSDLIERTGELAAAASKPISDIRGTAEYRKEMVRVATVRSLRRLKTGKEREGFPARPVMLWGPNEPHLEESRPEPFEHHPGMPIETRVNGTRYVVEAVQSKTLLRFLREDLGLIGTKEGCAEGECGACTVFLDGAAVMSCMVAAPRAHGAEIITIEGLARDGRLHPVQRAFIEEGAVQCGYCTPGFLMSGAKLLEEVTRPNRSQIEQSITGNLCRCTGYYKILTAIEKAAEMEQS